MTYERFLKIGLSLQKQDKVMSNLYDLNVDLLEFIDPYHTIISELMKEVYGEEGYDWFSWFCYEADYGQKDFSQYPLFSSDHKKIKEAGEDRWGAYDEDGNPICYSWESLYEYLQQYDKTNRV